MAYALYKNYERVNLPDDYSGGQLPGCNTLIEVTLSGGNTALVPIGDCVAGGGTDSLYVYSFVGFSIGTGTQFVGLVDDEGLDELCQSYSIAGYCEEEEEPEEPDECTDDEIAALIARTEEIDKEIAANSELESEIEAKMDSLLSVQQDVAIHMTKLSLFAQVTSALQFGSAVTNFIPNVWVSLSNTAGDIIGQIINAETENEALSAADTLINTFRTVNDLLDEWAKDLVEAGPKAIGRVAKEANNLLNYIELAEAGAEVRQRNVDLESALNSLYNVQQQAVREWASLSIDLDILQSQTSDLFQEKFEIDSQLLDCLLQGQSSVPTGPSLSSAEWGMLVEDMLINSKDISISDGTGSIDPEIASMDHHQHEIAAVNHLEDAFVFG